MKLENPDFYVNHKHKTSRALKRYGGSMLKASDLIKANKKKSISLMRGSTFHANKAESIDMSEPVTHEASNPIKSTLRAIVKFKLSANNLKK